jgi:RNA polymerase sigma factor (sigma-70 family)
MIVDQPTRIEDLIARVRGGDEAALAELLLRYEPKIRLTARYLLRPILRRYLDSIDVTQSVQVELVQGLRQGKFDLSDSDAFVALAVTVVRRKVARHWRHLQQDHRLRFGPSAEAHAASHSPTPPEAPIDPATDLERDEEIERLWQRFDPIERQLLELRIQGYTIEEAATQMGCRANVLRVRLCRLRKRLQEQGVLTNWF